MVIIMLSLKVVDSCFSLILAPNFFMKRKVRELMPQHLFPELMCLVICVWNCQRQAGFCPVQHLHSVYHFGIWDLCIYVQNHVNLRILFPNVPLMNKGPNEQNHL